MGKWDTVFKKVARQERNWGEEVDAARKAVGDRSPEGLRDAYRQVREAKAEVEERHALEMRPINAKVVALESLIADLYDGGYSAGPLRCIDGARVECNTDIEVKVVDKAALVGWVKANDLESLLSVHASTAKSVSKERLEAGEAPPDGVEARGFYKVKFVGPKK